MWKLVIPALAVALTGCGGGGGAGSGGSAIQAISLIPTVISQYKNEINSGTVFNSTVADLNGDGLDDIVLSGWAVAQSTHVGSRSGFVNLKIFIQQDNDVFCISIYFCICVIRQTHNRYQTTT